MATTKVLIETSETTSCRSSVIGPSFSLMFY